MQNVVIVTMQHENFLIVTIQNKFADMKVVSSTDKKLCQQRRNGTVNRKQMIEVHVSIYGHSTKEYIA